MAAIIRMPSVLAGAEEGAIAAWLVAEGDEVAVGDTIVEIETDKATVEYEAEEAGTVGRLLVPTGESALVGDPIVVLVSAGEDPAQAERELALPAGAEAAGAGAADAGDAGGAESEHPVPAAPAADAVSAPTATSAGAAEQQVTPAQDAAFGASATRLFASPIARKRAREHGIDVASLVGSGPNGRITRRDVDAAVRTAQTAQPTAAPPAGSAETAAAPVAQPAAQARSQRDAQARSQRDAEATLVPHSPMRRAIARRLTESQATIPQFQVVAECQVDKLLALRAQVNATRGGQKLSVNDFVVKAVAGALHDVPEANVTWTEEGMLRHTRADIAVAVATEGGLVTPVVRDVGSRSISAVGTAVAELAERARAKRLSQGDIEGGSFTVSNLGMYGTVGFTAIINPPHWGILAVGAAKPQPVVVDGALAVATVMRCTLSVDHRAVDGALAAQWMAAFQRRIEEPLLILV